MEKREYRNRGINIELGRAMVLDDAIEFQDNSKAKEVTCRVESWVDSKEEMAMECTLYSRRARTQKAGIRRSGIKARSLATSTVAILSLASTIPVTQAQSCISLSGTTVCPAFNSSSVSINQDLTSR